MIWSGEQVRTLAPLAFVLVLISFDVYRYLPSLGVSSTTENDGSQMNRKRKSKCKHQVCKGPQSECLISINMLTLVCEVEGCKTKLDVKGLNLTNAFGNVMNILNTLQTYHCFIIQL